jgi:hypothetical protein
MKTDYYRIKLQGKLPDRQTSLVPYTELDTFWTTDLLSRAPVAGIPFTKVSKSVTHTLFLLHCFACFQQQIPQSV